MNNGVRELTIDELDQVSGAFSIGPLSITSTDQGVVIWLKGVGGMSIHTDGQVCVDNGRGGGGCIVPGP